MADDRLSALTAAVISRPDDDTPRLMLADYLEHDADPRQPDRAAFIRVQVELARMGPDPRCECQTGPAIHGCPKDIAGRLRAREQALWTSHWRTLLGTLPGLTPAAIQSTATGNIVGACWVEPGDAAAGRTLPGIHPAFRRGFIEWVSCPAHLWLAHASALTWTPTAPCPKCRGTGEDGGHEYDRGMIGWCMACWDSKAQRSSGRVPRPCPETAHPIARVVWAGMTEADAVELARRWRLRFGRSAVGNTVSMLAADLWPGIAFSGPEIIDGHHRTAAAFDAAIRQMNADILGGLGIDPELLG